MKTTAAVALGLLLVGLPAAAARAEDGAAIKASLTMAESGGNVVVVQEPPRAPAPADGFISFDTVIIGCTAGAAAGALAIALPVLTVAGTGVGVPASASAILTTAGIGCAVGMASGLAAIGTAWGLNVLNGADGGNN